MKKTNPRSKRATRPLKRARKRVMLQSDVFYDPLFYNPSYYGGAFYRAPIFEIEKPGYRFVSDEERRHWHVVDVTNRLVEKRLAINRTTGELNQSWDTLPVEQQKSMTIHVTNMRREIDMLQGELLEHIQREIALKKIQRREITARPQTEENRQRVHILNREIDELHDEYIFLVIDRVQNLEIDVNLNEASKRSNSTPQQLKQLNDHEEDVKRSIRKFKDVLLSVFKDLLTELQSRNIPHFEAPRLRWEKDQTLFQLNSAVINNAILLLNDAKSGIGPIRDVIGISQYINRKYHKR